MPGNIPGRLGVLTESSTLAMLVSGSLAFDHIMVFPGHFEDHILPDKIHVLNVSFLVKSLERMRGGVAGNIAYSLALLHQPVRIVATVGSDFREYRSALEAVGVDTTGIVASDDELTASAFITTDRSDNQITGFYPGAMSASADLALAPYLDGVELGIISPTAPDAMQRHARELREAGVPYVFDPGQQIISLSAQALIDGIEGAAMLVGNDYEFAMIGEKTGMSREELLASCETVIITYGDLGSHVHINGELFEVPAAHPVSVVDPTGAGDAYRAGFLAARRCGLTPDVAGRVGSVAAAAVVEIKGTQGHYFTLEQFIERFNAEFPDYAGAVDGLRGGYTPQAAKREQDRS